MKVGLKLVMPSRVLGWMPKMQATPTAMSRFTRCTRAAHSYIQLMFSGFAMAFEG